MNTQNTENSQDTENTQNTENAENTPNTPNAPTRAPRRWLFWTSSLFLFPVLLIVLAVGGAVSTETGLNSVLALAKRVLPGQLSYNRISGRLLGPLQIEQLRYEDGPLKVTLANGQLDWKPAALFGGALNVTRLHVKGLELQLPPSDKAAAPPAPGPIALPDIQLPLAVNVIDLQGRDIRILPVGAEPIQIDAVDLKARAGADGLAIETLEVRSPLGEARLNGQLNPTGAYPLHIQLAWQLPTPAYGTFNGQGELQGELRKRLQLTHQITGAATLELNGEVLQPLDPQPAWTTQAKLDVADLKPFAPELSGKPLAVRLEAKGVLDRFEGQGELNATAPELGPTTVRFVTTGDASAVKLKELRLTAADRPLALNLKGDVQFADLRFNATGQWQSLVWPLHGPPQLESAKGEFAADGTPKDYRFQLAADVQAPNLPKSRWTLHGQGSDQAVRDLKLAGQIAEGKPMLNLQGNLQFADLRFNAKGEWQSLAWPLSGPPQVESAKGEVAADGTPKDYRFQLAADVQGPNIPKGHWTLSGQGSDQAVRDVKLVGQTLEGKIESTANVAWLPAVRWQADLNGAGLNPGAHWPAAPGKLNLRLKSDGSLENAALRAHLLLEELSGVLNKQAVRGNADVTVQDQDLSFKTLRFNAGDARLEAEGSLTQRWDLRWKLDLPQLQTLVSTLNGTIASTGALSGSRDRPVVATSFTVKNLRQGDTQIQQLRGQANVDVSGANRSQLKISGEGLTLGGQNWKTLTLDGGGTPTAHELKAELAGDPGRFLLALAGSLQTPSLLWQGRLTQLAAKDTVAGAWNLDKPAALRASAREASLDSACLSSAPTRVCLQGQWNQSGAFNGKVQLTNLTPDRFKTFLPQGMALATSVGGEATASGNIGGALQGKLALNIAPGSLKMEANGQPVRFTLNGGNLQLETNGRTASGQARLDLAQIGQVQASLQAQDPLGAARINGKLNATVTDLKVVSAFAPQLQNVTGQLRADVNVAGAVPKLAVKGEVRLENAGAAIPEAGLKLQNLQFTAASTGQGPLRLSGSVDSEPGQLQLSGELDPLQPHLNLAIKGEKFQALKTTDLQVQISPDLKVDLTQQQARVDGTVTIPKAWLRPGGVGPGTVKASDDAVIVKNPDGATPTAKKSTGPEIYAKVRVILGDDIQLETPVFKGRLKGDLAVEETPELAPRGSGSAEVVAGKYRIYGQDIEIQRGRLLFSNSPLDNPGLDLRVARQMPSSSSGSDPVIAGAQIRGTLKQPKLTFFSTPTMPDQEILSYLVLGRLPQGGGSGSEAAMLFKAAGAMGMGSSGGLGESAGLDTLELGGNGGGDTSLMVGKYLTPDLYVGYGVGLLNAVNTFNVKYRFTKHLQFESASSSIGTGADLIYTIEH